MYVCVYVCEGACADKFCFDELFQCRRLLQIYFHTKLSFQTFFFKASSLSFTTVICCCCFLMFCSYLTIFFITLLFTFSVSISKFSFLGSTYCSLSFPFSSKTSSETLSEIRAGADRRCFPSVRTPVLQNRTQLPV